MTLLIGKDRQDRTHYVKSNAREKACGYSMAMCGTEVLPQEDSTEPVQCFYCNHAYDLGVHLIDTKTPA